MDGKLVRDWYGTDDLTGEDGLSRACYLSQSLGQAIGRGYGESIEHFLEIIGKGETPFQKISHAIVHHVRDAAMKILERPAEEDDRPMSEEQSKAWLKSLGANINGVYDAKASAMLRLNASEALSGNFGESLMHPTYLINAGEVRGYVRESSNAMLVSELRDASDYVQHYAYLRKDPKELRSALLVFNTLADVADTINITLQDKKWSDIVRANGGLQ